MDGDGSVAAPSQGAPAAGAQPGAPGQGGAQGQPTAGKGDAVGQFNWDLFPDVPAEHREILQPHLKNIQGHVTRLEQSQAPYKGLMEAVSPDAVEGLVGFLSQYNTDPVATYLGMAQNLQENGAIPATADLTALEAIIRGQQAPQQGAQPGQEEMPAWAQQMQQQLAQQNAEKQQQAQAEQAARVEQENQQTLETATTNIRGQLTQAGIGEDQVSDTAIVAFIIANDGDEQLAAQAISEMRNSFLSSFTTQSGAGPKPPAVNGALPQPPKGGRKGDPYAQAKDAAAQFLKQQAAASAQG